MVSVQERKDIERDHRKFLTQKSDDYRHENDKIYRAYVDSIAQPGATEESVFPVLYERFGCTPRRIKNLISKRSGTLNPATKAMTEGILTTQLYRIYDSCADAVHTCDRDLDEVEEQMRDGIEWADVERTDGTSVKGPTEQFKRVPIAVHRRSLEDRKIKKLQEFIDSVGRLVQRQDVRLVRDGDDVMGMSLDALLLEEKQLEKQLKIMPDKEDTKEE